MSTTIYLFEYKTELYIRTTFDAIRNLIVDLTHSHDFTYDAYAKNRSVLEQEDGVVDDGCFGSWIEELGGELEEGCESISFGPVGPTAGYNSVGTIHLMEITFKPDEQIGIMRCEGSSSECCFIQRKTKEQFWMEAMDYMCEASETDNGCCNVGVVFTQYCNYRSKTVSYRYLNGEKTDLMTFTYIDNIC